MRSVHAPAGLAAPAPARRLPVAPLAAVALVIACAALAAALLTHGSAAPRRPAAGAVIGAVPLQRARCVDWPGASSAERTATFRALAAGVGGATGFGPASTLSSAQAGALFDGTCSHAYARSFLLYELYIRAAGFRSLLPTSGR